MEPALDALSQDVDVDINSLYPLILLPKDRLAEAKTLWDFYMRLKPTGGNLELVPCDEVVTIPVSYGATDSSRCSSINVSLLDAANPENDKK